MPRHRFDYVIETLGSSDDSWGRLLIACPGCGDRRLVWPDDDLGPHNADPCPGARVTSS